MIEILPFSNLLSKRWVIGISFEVYHSFLSQLAQKWQAFRFKSLKSVWKRCVLLHKPQNDATLDIFPDSKSLLSGLSNEVSFVSVFFKQVVFLKTRGIKIYVHQCISSRVAYFGYQICNIGPISNQVFEHRLIKIKIKTNIKIQFPKMSVVSLVKSTLEIGSL